MLKSKRKGFLLSVTLSNLYKDDSYSYFLFNILIILPFLISTWTAESVSNSSRKQRITFFNWLATPNKVKPSCSCSPWQSHETGHGRCKITDFHCLRKQDRVPWVPEHVPLTSITSSWSPFAVSFPSNIIHKTDSLFHASVLFRLTTASLLLTIQRLCSPGSGFKSPILLSPFPLLHMQHLVYVNHHVTSYTGFFSNCSHLPFYLNNFPLSNESMEMESLPIFKGSAPPTRNPCDSRTWRTIPFFSGSEECLAL